VLALLAEGLTNKEIAGRLYLSPRTGVDQVQAEVAEEQLLAEARELPLGLARGLDDVSCLLLCDGDCHWDQRSFAVGAAGWITGTSRRWADKFWISMTLGVSMAGKVSPGACAAYERSTHEPATWFVASRQ
jgi:hypothetical protein